MLDDPDYQSRQLALTDLCGGHPTRTWESVAALEKAGTGHRALEVGAWPLLFSRGLKQQFEHVIATDSYAWAMRPEVAESNPSPEEWSALLAPNVETRQADVTLLPWSDQYFDCAVGISMLEHVEDDFLALNELCRVARRVVITTDIAPNRQGYFAYSRVYCPASLARLIETATGKKVDAGKCPPQSQWLYPDFTVCAFSVEV